ncbi:TolC family protein [candidate division KSB1 bacterium]
MKKTATQIFIVLSCLLLIFSPLLRAQEKHVLTWDDAIKIALKSSYTVKSYNLQKESSEQSFNYWKAQFKPKLNFELNAPRWSENVVPIARADGLPVYNSTGSFRTGGNLNFQYILPTGGNLYLSSAMYKDNLKTVLAMSDYEELKEDRAQTSLTLGFEQDIFTRNELNESLKEAQFAYEKFLNRYTRGEMDIIYSVTFNFYQLYRATRQVEIASEKLKNSEEAYRIAKLKSETGRIPEGELLTSDIQMENDKSDLSDKEGNLQSLKDSFKQLIGLPLEDDISIVTNLQYETFEIDDSKATEEALKNRRELDEAKLDIQLQEIEVDRAKRVKEFKGKISGYYDIVNLT